MQNKPYLNYDLIAQDFKATRSGKFAYSKVGCNIKSLASFVKSVGDQMLACALVVERDKNYMLKTMFPAEYWVPLVDKARDDERGVRKIIAGRIASYLVNCGYMPFEKHVTASGSGSLKYRLK